MASSCCPTANRPIAKSNRASGFFGSASTFWRNGGMSPAPSAASSSSTADTAAAISGMFFNSMGRVAIIFSAASRLPIARDARITPAMATSLSGASAWICLYNASASSGEPASNISLAASRACSIGGLASPNSRLMKDLIWLSATEPANPSTGRPSLKAKTAGIDWTRNCAASSWFSSMFILTMRTRPPAWVTAFSRAGPNCLQGPHHGAQKSTMMGTCMEASMTSCMKLAVFESFINGPPAALGAGMASGAMCNWPGCVSCWAPGTAAPCGPAGPSIGVMLPSGFILNSIFCPLNCGLSTLHRWRIHGIGARPQRVNAPKVR